MEMMLETLPLEDLLKLHGKAKSSLEQLLIEGAEWSEVKAYRALVTDLAIIIHKRKHPIEISGFPEGYRPDSNRESKP